MTVRSVLQIDVQDEAFQRFAKLYDHYAAQLGAAPAHWQASTQQARGLQGVVNQITAAIRTQTGVLLAHTSATNANVAAATRAATAWGTIAGYTRQAAANIASGAAGLIRWGSVLGAISGVGGVIGGGIGIDRLAQDVAGTRQRALGLGATYGGVQAFGTDLSRIVGPGFLDAVAEAKSSISGSVGLLTAGISSSQANGPTEVTAAALLKRYKQLADQWNPRFFAEQISAFHLPGATPELFRLLRGTSSAELGTLLGQFGTDRNKLNLPPATQLAYQNFITSLDQAKKGIEAAFVKGLVPLIPGLTKLGPAVERVVTSVLKWVENTGLIDKLGEGLNKFADTVGSPEFEKSVESALEGLAKFGKAVASVAEWIFGKFGGKEELKIPGVTGQVDSFANRFHFNVLNEPRFGLGLTGNTKLKSIGTQRLGDAQGDVQASSLLALRGVGGANTAGLSDEFAARLARAISAAESATGERAVITSLKRSTEEQAELYRRYLSGQGGLAAPPGRSRHEFGEAADIKRGAVLDYLHKHAEEYGLEFLKGKAFSADPVHVQMKRGHLPDQSYNAGQDQTKVVVQFPAGSDMFTSVNGIART